MKPTVPILIALVLAACGGKSGLADLKKLKDEACACKDKACAAAVDKKLDATLEKIKEPSQDEAQKIQDVMEAAGICIANASH